MQATEASQDDETITSTADELHNQAIRFIVELNQLIFEDLPEVIAQIIKQEVWKDRTLPYQNFGEYALDYCPEGLGVTNNEMLVLLKSAMSKNNQNGSHWASVLGEVDTNVRTYAKKNNIPIYHLSGHLSDFELSHPKTIQEGIITYLPSRSNSHDGQLLKLKKNDPQAYEDVIYGKRKLDEALQKPPRKKLVGIESVKSKFSGLSKAEQAAFIAWLEEEKGNS